MRLCLCGLRHALGVVGSVGDYGVISIVLAFPRLFDSQTRIPAPPKYDMTKQDIQREEGGSSQDNNKHGYVRQRHEVVKASVVTQDRCLSCEHEHPADLQRLQTHERGQMKERSEMKRTIPMKQATGTQNTFSLPLSNTRVHSAIMTMREMLRTYLPAFILNEISAQTINNCGRSLAVNLPRK